MSKSITNNNERIGSIYGFVGVVGFSGTLPATRIAVAIGRRQPVERI